jgi:hypothetical protein
MENKIYNKPMYKCAICDSIYETVTERMKCEAACIEKAEQEAAKIAEEKKKLEKDVRKAEVELAIKTANELFHKYVEDYGSYEFYCDLSDMNEDDRYFWPSRLLHHWLS